jgi:hypothetical protein
MQYCKDKALKEFFNQHEYVVEEWRNRLSPAMSSRGRRLLFPPVGTREPRTQRCSTPIVAMLMLA